MARRWWWNRRRRRGDASWLPRNRRHRRRSLDLQFSRLYGRASRSNQTGNLCRHLRASNCRRHHGRTSQRSRTTIRSCARNTSTTWLAAGISREYTTVPAAARTAAATAPAAATGGRSHGVDHPRTSSILGPAFRVEPGEGGLFWGWSTLSIGAREFGVRSMEGDGLRAGGGTVLELHCSCVGHGRPLMVDVHFLILFV